MSRRRLGLFGAIVAGVLVVGLLVLNSMLAPIFGSAPNEHSELQATLFQAAQKAGVGGTVSLADVEPADWDLIYIWDGYTADREHVIFPGVDFGNGGYGSDYVIAFANAGHLIAWVRFKVNDPHVFFDPPGSGIRASRNAAVFAVTLHPDFPTTQYLLVIQ
jgi:hypothetical protein